MNVTTKVTGPQSINLDISDYVKQVQDEAAEGLEQDVKSASTAIFGSGPYSQGWTWKRQGNSTVVYNSGKQSSLTHLLENGHMIVDRNKKSHGRWVPPRQHITPGYIVWKAMYIKMLKLAVKNAKGKGE